MQLSDYIGQEIAVLIPFLHTAEIQCVKLHGVEVGGVWIESQAVINAMLKTAGGAAISKTPVLFLPYNQIVMIAGAVEGLALNEKAFGV